MGGRFFVVNAAMSQISAHPLVWAQSRVQRPWALFRETTVYWLGITTNLGYRL